MPGSTLEHFAEHNGVHFLISYIDRISHNAYSALAMNNSVLEYTDYRVYLRDWVKARKERGFSLRQFARTAGISSPNYLQRVLQNKTKLTEKMSHKFTLGLGLKNNEADYFRTLVRLNQNETNEISIECLQRLSQIAPKAKLAKVESRNLMREWYYPIIWEMASCKGATLTPESIVRALNNKITKTEARSALHYLIKAQYLTPGKTPNSYIQKTQAIKNIDEVANPYSQKVHKIFSEIAVEALETDLTHREFQGLTIAVGPDKIPLVKKSIKEFSQHLQNILAADQNADRVYRINIQFFPTTKEVLSGGH